MISFSTSKEQPFSTKYTLDEELQQPIVNVNRSQSLSIVPDSMDNPLRVLNKIEPIFYKLKDHPPRKPANQTAIQSDKRGFALILNHCEYEKGYQNKRDGTQHDVNELQRVFNSFNIETDVETDCRVAQIQCLLNRLIYRDFSNYACFIIVILTHHGAQKDNLCAHDKEYNFINIIEEPLLQGNETLQQKSKIFIYPSQKSTVPKRNVLKCYATYEGYSAYRDQSHGSIFIQIFCEKLQQIGKTASIYEIMNKVTRVVVKLQTTKAQVPNIVSSETKPYGFVSYNPVRPSDIGVMQLPRLASVTNTKSDELLQKPIIMPSKRRFALILNHSKYAGNYQKMRNGTEADVDSLKTVFGEHNIETFIQNDLTVEKIQRLVDKLKNRDFSKYECFIVVILTHGQQNDEMCAHDKSFNFKTVIEEPLLENKTLADKSKIFIIEPCRDKENGANPSNENDSVQNKSEEVEVSSQDKSTVIAKQNIFKCNVAGEWCTSKQQKGCIFIQTFCQKLEKFGNEYCVYKIMNQVISSVSEETNDAQVPTILSSGTKPFFFGNLKKSNSI